MFNLDITLKPITTSARGAVWQAPWEILKVYLRDWLSHHRDLKEGLRRSQKSEMKPLRGEWK